MMRAAWTVTDVAQPDRRSRRRIIVKDARHKETIADAVDMASSFMELSLILIIMFCELIL